MSNILFPIGKKFLNFSATEGLVSYKNRYLTIFVMILKPQISSLFILIFRWFWLSSALIWIFSSQFGTPPLSFRYSASNSALLRCHFDIQQPIRLSSVVISIFSIQFGTPLLSFRYSAASSALLTGRNGSSKELLPGLDKTGIFFYQNTMIEIKATKAVS